MSKFAENEVMHVGDHFIPIALGSASPSMGRGPPFSCTYSNSKVVLYPAKPTCSGLYDLNGKIPFLPFLSIPSNGKGVLEFL